MVNQQNVVWDARSQSQSKISLIQETSSNGTRARLSCVLLRIMYKQNNYHLTLLQITIHLIIINSTNTSEC